MMFHPSSHGDTLSAIEEYPRQNLQKANRFNGLFHLNLSYEVWLWILLIGIMLIRLLFIGTYPLADTTEARYGEMGRLMVELGDWITPQFEKGVPFWGKPPLSFWLTAISFKLFGISEFSARLPSFILGIAVIAMVFGLGRSQSGTKTALAASVILASCIIFWISSGAVMTDNCLLAGTTLSMVAFRQWFTSSKQTARMWGYLFFVGLSIGMMAKGPVAVVLIFFPVSAWTLIQKKWDLLLKFPWKTGLILTAILTLPWYIAAELKTPGFIEYFIIGEHWNRFLVPGWKGDLYGSAHDQPKGMIWGFWVICTLPWSIFLPCMFIKKKNRNIMKEKVKISKDWYLYLVFWATAPMIFFTMAGNILWAYVLPGIPAFSLLSAQLINVVPGAEQGLKKISATLSAVFLIVSLCVLLGVGPDRNSQKKLVSTVRQISQGESLYYLYRRPFSAEFYSKGQAKEISSVPGLTDMFKNDKKDFLAVKRKYLTRIPDETLSQFDQKRTVNGYVLFKEK